MFEQFIQEFIAHEDIWIFVILVILVINSIIIVWSLNKESKKTDMTYRFIKELLEKAKEKKE